MKNIISIILLLLCLTGWGQGNIPVSSLPVADTLGGADFYPVIQNGHYKKVGVGVISTQLQHYLDSISALTGGWGLSGNAGTTYPTNFIGTTDAQPLFFKVNSSFSGVVATDATNNTSLGYGANQGNGTANSAFGATSLGNNSSGYENTAIGHSALSGNVSGGGNVGVGSFTLDNNFNGSNNTAVGYFSLASNQSGHDLTAIGDYADVKDGLTDATAIGSHARSNQNNTMSLMDSAYACVGIGTTVPRTLLTGANGLAVSQGNLYFKNAAVDNSYTIQTDTTEVDLSAGDNGYTGALHVGNMFNGFTEGAYINYQNGNNPFSGTGLISTCNFSGIGLDSITCLMGILNGGPPNTYFAVMGSSDIATQSYGETGKWTRISQDTDAVELSSSLGYAYSFPTQSPATGSLIMADDANYTQWSNVLEDYNGTFSVDYPNRFLDDAGGIASEDWANRYLNNQAGTTVANWQGGSGGIGIQFPLGAGNGYVLTSDVSGNASWQAPPGGGSSSFYAPIAEALSNCSYNIDSAQYMRVGNVVTVSGSVSIVATAPGAAYFAFNIPVPSNLNNRFMLSGTASNEVGESGSVYTNGTNNYAEIHWVAASTGVNNVWTYTFTYSIR